MLNSYTSTLQIGCDLHKFTCISSVIKTLKVHSVLCKNRLRKVMPMNNFTENYFAIYVVCCKMLLRVLFIFHECILSLFLFTLELSSPC